MKELRLRGISTPEAANAYAPEFIQGDIVAHKRLSAVLAQIHADQRRCDEMS